MTESPAVGSARRNGGGIESGPGMVGDVHFGRGNVSVAHFFRWISHPGPIASTESSTESSAESSAAAFTDLST